MSDRFVTLESYQFLPEAEAVRMHLAAEGINAYLADAETVSTEWSLGNAIGYIKLQVPEPQSDAARVLLNELRERRSERDFSPESDAVGRCLACGVSLSPNQSKCEQCGWTYADADDPSDEFTDDAQPANAVGSEGSVLENLRAIKRPIMLVVLMPMLMGLALIAIVILAWVLQMVTGLHFL